MSDLRTLHRRLAALRRRRTWVRWASAISAVLCGVLWTLLLILVVDLLFELDIVQRLLVFALGGAGVACSFRRSAWPLLRVCETEIQLALLVEKQYALPSDLVAAIQFERPEAAGWGSPQLEQAVVEHTATLAPRLDGPPGFSHTRATRRLAAAWLTVAAVSSLAYLFPEHARVFVRRLALSADRYPSATVIETAALNGRQVLVRRVHETTPMEIKCAEGHPVAFAVRCSGRLPTAGQARLKSRGGRQRTVDLRRTASPGLYAGQLPRLVATFTYQLYLGDAWTDPARVEMLPLPIVEMQLSPTPPVYSRAVETDAIDPAARQIAVLEGSDVDVAVRCANNKRLSEVWLTVTSDEPPTRHVLIPASGNDGWWHLSPGTAPFAQVDKEIRFELQVLDQDQMSLETPIRGQVRVRKDRPPVCSADVVHRVVLPTATPVVEYRVNDDYGLAGLTLHVDVQRFTETRGEAETVQCTSEVLPGPKPLAADELPREGRFPVPLDALQAAGRSGPEAVELAKGDRLRLYLEAIDHRGPLPGQAARSDPLVLEVSDARGVLTAISEADERSEQRLTDIIKQQRGIADE